MTSAPPLSQFVSVRGRFVRSAHLERDFRDRRFSGYQLTECAYQVLKAVASAFEHPAQRAITLTGPYGAGKSAFCLHLAQMLEKRADSAAEYAALKQQDAALHQTLSEKKLIPVLVVGARQSLAKALVAGLKLALAQGEYTKILTQLCASFPETLDSPEPTARQVADLYRQAAALAGLEKANGLLLIMDEMGKFFEYAALYPKSGDVFVLQELAEAAARSGDSPLFVLGVLHQNVEAYSQKLGRAHQGEWAKVSERFRQINFFPTDGERLELVGKALEQTPRLNFTDGFETLCRECVALDLLPSGIRARFAEKARAAYPLHPVSLLALPALFRRAGQSHRSMFSFLAGEEPHAMGRFLRETPYDDRQPPLFMLDALFDYAGEALVGGWGASQWARLWAEAVEIIEHATNISLEARRVLKCIGLLGILRDPKLRATDEMLRLALTDSVGRHPDIAGVIAELKQRKVILYSRTRRMYRLWEGGDVDVEEELSRAKTGLQGGVSLHVATALCPPPRLIARRHSYRTGTMRTVQIQPCAAPQLDAAMAASGDALTILLCLAATQEELEQAEMLARAVTRPNLLIALAAETEMLREAASDVAAVRLVEKETRALDHDGAARRELAARATDAEVAFQTEWERLFGARQSEAMWYYAQETQTFLAPRAFSAFLSYMADRSYESAPSLRNELINRRVLSSAAASGRRTLIEAMLQQSAEPKLSIKGAPPELSMYECVLRATGIHRENPLGAWKFGEPSEDDPANLRPVWNALAETLFAEPPAPISVAELFARLEAPPFGMTEGVLPILLCAFLLAHEGETTLYREGTFVPEPSITDWEILLRRPELFSVAGCRVQGERAVVVNRLASGLQTEPSVIPIVRNLVRMVRGLPEYAWKTRRIPPEILALREAFDKAHSPERLLFHDLPAALNVTVMADEEVSGANVEAFFSALNAGLRAWSQATPNQIAEARDILLKSCGLPVGEAGFTELRKQAVNLEGQVLNSTLLTFLRRVIVAGDDQAVLDGIISLVASRSPRSWTDMDADRFPSQVSVIGALFRQAQTDKVEPVKPVLTTLEDQEAEQCERLVIHLKKQFSPKLPTRVRRAALLELLRELEAE